MEINEILKGALSSFEGKEREIVEFILQTIKDDYMSSADIKNRTIAKIDEIME